MMIYTTSNKTPEGVEDHSPAFYFLRNMSLDIGISLHTHLLSFFHSLAPSLRCSAAPLLLCSTARSLHRSIARSGWACHAPCDTGAGTGACGAVTEAESSGD